MTPSATLIGLLADEQRLVNELLNALHDDHVTLRRHLVDAGLLQRSQGIYRRA
jgi:hypothetical protein